MRASSMTFWHWREIPSFKLARVCSWFVDYGVLRRLGYSEEIVERCLESIDGVDLEEAHGWVR